MLDETGFGSAAPTGSTTGAGVIMASDPGGQKPARPGADRAVARPGQVVWLRAAATVFSSSIAIVIGPTPPGTGVMADATCAAAA